MNADRNLDRGLDGAVGLFALWTLACHLAVLGRGGLAEVAALFATLVGAAALILLRRARLQPAIPPAAGQTITLLPAPTLSPRTHWMFLVWAIALLGLVFPSWQHLDLFWIGSTLYFAVALFVARTPPPLTSETRVEPGRRLVPLLALGLALLALCVCRPDYDDTYHLNAAVTMARFPAEPILSRTTMVFDEPTAFWQPPVYVFQTLEVWVAAVSWLTRLPAIAVAHFGLTALGALVTVLCLWRLLRQLTPGFAFWTLLAVVFYLMADGGGNASFGNHGGFVRLHQGKALFLAALLPLISAYALEFVRAPSWPAFIRLAAAQVASIGLSATALLMAPLMLVLTLFAAGAGTRTGWRRIGLGTLAGMYPLLLGLYCVATMRGYSSELPAAPTGSAAALLRTDVIQAVLGQHPLAFTAVCGVLAAWLVAPNATARRYFIVPPLAALLTVFNPWLAPLLAHTLMPQPIYYRLLWLCLPPVAAATVLCAPACRGPGQPTAFLYAVAAVPFALAGLFKTGDPFGLRFKLAQPDAGPVLLWNGVLLLCLLAIGLAALRRLPAIERRAGVTALTVMSLFFILVPVFYVLAPDNALEGSRLTVGAPALKVDRETYRIAKLINAHVPDGAAVLAPDAVSVWIPTAKRHARPLVARLEYMGMLHRALGSREAERRYRLQCAVSGSDPEQAAATLQEGLEYYPLAAVCLAPAAAGAAVAALLQQHGFTRLDTGRPYRLWVKTVNW